MIKKIAAVVLILLSGGAWLALDYLNKQEQAHALEMHKGLDKARQEAKHRAQVQGSFKSLIQSNLESCETAAEKSHTDYMALMQTAVPAKRKGQVAIPQAILDQSAVILQNEKDTCQQTYSEQQKSGL